jgi:hypothetical protein
MPTAAPLNLFDYEALAKDRVHPAVWDIIVAGLRTRSPSPRTGGRSSG